MLSAYIKSTSDQLQNQDMLIPLTLIEKGIMQFNNQKVEKNLKYLQKLFDSALDDLVKAKVTQKQSELED